MSNEQMLESMNSRESAMDTKLYEQFLTLKNQGQKDAAQSALRAFIASFRTAEEKRSWVFSFLQEGHYGHKIRHEVYQQLVYPVLLEGYLRYDPISVLWMARTAHQLHTIPKLHPRLQDKSGFSLLREAYQLQPHEEVRCDLLAMLLNRFSYAQHEWPAGILFEADGATPEQCQEMLQEIAFARQLDHENQYSISFSEFEARVQQYIVRLRAQF